MRRDQKALRNRMTQLVDDLVILPTGAPSLHIQLIQIVRETLVEAVAEIVRLNIAVGEQTRLNKKRMNRIHHVQQSRVVECETYRSRLAEHKAAVEDLESRIISTGGEL